MFDDKKAQNQHKKHFKTQNKQQKQTKNSQRKSKLPRTGYVLVVLTVHVYFCGVSA